MISIRLAKKRDTKSILEIYKPYITDAPVSFEETVPSEIEFRKRIQKVITEYPWLVCEINNSVVGYAYASNHRDRSCYRWTKEVSVYIHKEYSNRGIAKGLYTSLIEILKIQGVINVLAGITLPNEKSVLFHESLGFKKVGVYTSIGFKFGKWHDSGWWQLKVNTKLSTPNNELKKLNLIIDTDGWKVAINKGLSKINLKK